MKLILGLGNPGSSYLITRHNIGFMVIDSMAKANQFQNKHKSHLFKAQIENQTVLLAKPQTYMNLSGEACREILSFYKIQLEDFLVIQDDVDLPFSQIRFHKNKTSGGHNGIQNIHEEINTSDYARLKIGVGKSQNPNISTSDHVLAPFSKEEIEQLPKLLEKAIEACCFFLKTDFKQAANKFNS